MDASPDQLLEGKGRAMAVESVMTPPRALPPTAAIESMRGVTTPLTEVEIMEASNVESAELVEEAKGWDIPPAGVKVKKNPDPPPRFIPV